MKYLLLLLVSCSSFNTIDYPDHWWKSVDVKSVQWWEIPPDRVTKESNKVILSKRNELGILSNFSATPFKLDGKRFQTIEGLWQSMKFPESINDSRYQKQKLKYSRDEVSQMSGFAAKKAGDYATLLMKKYNIDWVTYRGEKIIYRENIKGRFYSIVLKAMKAKLKQNKSVRDVLNKTGSLELLPDHTTSPKDPPAWKYHQIWMGLRSELY